MTRKIVIANWKMKLNLEQSLKLALSYKRLPNKDLEIVACPSFIYLREVAEIFKKSHLTVGGQDCFGQDYGAYTGEVAAEDLWQAGARYVIIGHSERRTILGETDVMIHHKIKAALTAGLVPILCVGETFEARQQGNTDYVLINQVTAALNGISLADSQDLIVAYEPVWVIGSGQAISPAQALAAHQVIWQTLYDIFPDDQVANSCRVIYGGSVDADNVSSFTKLESINGVLVGGASLKYDEFSGIINHA